MRNKEQSEIPVNESAKEEVNFITFNVHKIIDATCKNNIYIYMLPSCAYIQNLFPVIYPTTFVGK